jgi:prevent-host-death family protein
MNMPISAARARLADVIDDARVGHEPIFLTRRDREVAAIIDAGQLRALMADAQRARRADAEADQLGFLDSVRADWGDW